MTPSLAPRKQAQVPKLIGSVNVAVLQVVEHHQHHAIFQGVIQDFVSQHKKKPKCGSVYRD